MLPIFDRVKETTNSGGASNVTLNGPVLGFQSFASTVGVGNQTYYGIVDNYSGDWEIGIGTLVDPITLSRDSQFSSSNAGGLVNFANSIKFVLLSVPAEAWSGGVLLSEIPTQILTSPNSQIVVVDGTPVTPIITTSLNNVALTATPIIAGTPRNGQLLILRNDNGINEAGIVFSDTNYVQGTGIRLDNDTFNMEGNSIMGLIYTTTEGTGPGWIKNWYMKLKIYEGLIKTFTINVGFGDYNSQYLEVANNPWPIPDPSNPNDLGSQFIPTFKWTYSGVPTYGTVSNGGINGAGEEAGYPATLISPFLTLIGPPVNKGTSVGATETFTPYIAVSGPVLTTPTASLIYINRRYLGTENYNNPALIDNTINNFPVAILDVSQYATWPSTTAGAGVYIWICLRSALTQPYFAITNVLGLVRAGFSPADDDHPAYTQLHTNASGFIENYDQWVSHLSGMGTVTITTQPNPAANFRYYLSNSTTGLLSDSTINAATVLDILATMPVTETVNGSNGYVYMIYPSRLGGPTYIQVNGYIAGTINEGTQNHRNIYGYLEPYVQFSTNTSSLGNTAYTFTTTKPINKYYAGALSQNNTLLSSAQVVALGTSAPSGNPYNTFTIAAGPSVYPWYAYPTRYPGSVYFGVFISSLSTYQWANFSLIGTQSVTNEQGYTENFYEYAGISNDWTGDLLGINPQTIAVSSTAFNNRIYMGPSIQYSSIDSDQILAIATTTGSITQLWATIAGSYTPIYIEAGNYMWFCHPSRFGMLNTIKDHVSGFGLAGGYMNNTGGTYPTNLGNIITVSHTNSTGYTEPYYVWRSDNPGIYPSSSYPTGIQIDVT